VCIVVFSWNVFYSHNLLCIYCVYELIKLKKSKKSHICFFYTTLFVYKILRLNLLYFICNKKEISEYRSVRNFIFFTPSLLGIWCWNFVYRWSMIERICMIFLDFLNFISSYVRYIPNKTIFTWYTPLITMCLLKNVFKHLSAVTCVSLFSTWVLFLLYKLS
jgi:hypothetical protein